jgi:hypothetical protein
MFSIGNPNNPTKDDARFEDQEDAEIAAIEASIDDSVWAVWDENGEVVALAFGRVIFNP